jgi:hypothetical protein
VKAWYEEDVAMALEGLVVMGLMTDAQADAHLRAIKRTVQENEQTQEADQ